MARKRQTTSFNFKKPTIRDIVMAILSALIGAFTASCAA